MTLNPKPNQSLSPKNTNTVQVIVCGLGRTGYRIFSLLRQQGIEVSGISDRPLPTDTQRIVMGDPRAATTLIRAGVSQARTLIIASSKESENLAILMQARLLNPKIFVINRLFNAQLGERLDQTLPYHSSLSVSTLAAPIFTFAAMGSKAIGQLTLSGRTWPIHEEFIHQRHPWRGRLLREIWGEDDKMLIYYFPVQLTPPDQAPTGEAIAPSAPPEDSPPEAYGDVYGDDAPIPEEDFGGGSVMTECPLPPRKADLVGAVLAN